jgi:hypothetical protein
VPHNRTRRVISAADGQALQTAQQIMNSVRSAYQAEPDAMLIADATLNPLELIVVDGQSGRYFRVPVTSNDDGSFSFGAPIPVTGPTSPNAYPSPPSAVNPGQPGGTASLASRGISARDQQRIQAAVSRGAILPERAAFWAAKAAAGEDISVVDQAVGGLLPTAGTVAAAAAPRDADAEHPEYCELFGTVQAAQRRADASEVAARSAVAALTDDQVYENIFGKGSAAPAPVSVSAAGGGGQHGQGESGQRRYRVHTLRVSLRVPQSPNGVAAGADPAETSWRTIELRGGDLVPADAHPADVARLLHQKTQLGPMLKPW